MLTWEGGDLPRNCHQLDLELLSYLREAHRVLSLDGQIILVQHLRDLPNFVAFGPGFLHFHAGRS